MNPTTALLLVTQKSNPVSTAASIVAHAPDNDTNRINDLFFARPTYPLAARALIPNKGVTIGPRVAINVCSESRYNSIVFVGGIQSVRDTIHQYHAMTKYKSSPSPKTTAEVPGWYGDFNPHRHAPRSRPRIWKLCSSKRNLIRGAALVLCVAVIYYGQPPVLDPYTTTNTVEMDESKSSGDSNDADPFPPITTKDGTQLTSAKTLLHKPPPFNDKDILTLYPSVVEEDGEREGIDVRDQPLIESPNTVVTGYFKVPSKASADKYKGWMANMLSLQDAMVIFTEPAFVDQIKEYRQHAANRTVIVPMDLNDLPWGGMYTEEFWQDQLDRDPEKRIHRSYQLFWIWLSKSWCVTQAIKMNFFKSDVFVWSDIGCFRDRKYNSKTMILHRETIPRNEILQMAHHRPNPPAENLFNDKYHHKDNFYHSGSQFVGYSDTIIRFHELFLETIDRFLEKGMIIVEDQAVLQSTCLSHPEICAYLPFKQVKDNHYFGLRYALHHGGDYNYWRYKPEQETNA